MLLILVPWIMLGACETWAPAQPGFAPLPPRAAPGHWDEHAAPRDAPRAGGWRAAPEPPRPSTAGCACGCPCCGDARGAAPQPPEPGRWMRSPSAPPPARQPFAPPDQLHPVPPMPSPAPAPPGPDGGRRFKRRVESSEAPSRFGAHDPSPDWIAAPSPVPSAPAPREFADTPEPFAEPASWLRFEPFGRWLSAQDAPPASPVPPAPGDAFSGQQEAPAPSPAPGNPPQRRSAARGDAVPPEPSEPRQPNPGAAPAAPDAESDEIIRVIQRADPQLAQRLRGLRARSPARYEQLVLDALVGRLRDASIAEQPEPGAWHRAPGRLAPPDLPTRDAPPPGFGDPGDAPGPRAFPRPRPGGFGSGGGPERGNPSSPDAPAMEPGASGRWQARSGERPAGALAESEQRAQALQAQDRQLAERTQALAGSNRPLAAAQLEEIRSVATQHFEVRTQLRQLELERIAAEMARLHQRIEQLRADLERRIGERDSIIERRVRELSGAAGDGW